MKILIITIILVIAGCAPSMPTYYICNSSNPVIVLPNTKVTLTQGEFYKHNDTTKLNISITDSCNSSPVLLYEDTTEYPEIARRAGVEGNVTLELTVDQNGKVIQSRVLKTDATLFNKPSIDAANKLIYLPYKENCLTQKFTSLIKLSFSLHRSTRR